MDDLFGNEWMHHIEWSAYLPHLNPIENVSEAIGGGMAQYNQSPRSKKYIVVVLKQEWQNLTKNLADNMAKSTHNLRSAYITVISGHIPY